jgi:SAM-dependent methyltransferase
MSDDAAYGPAFLAVYEAAPQQGPGDRASTLRALALCTDLPAAPRIVDLGCGSGRQTLDLAEATDGTIVAIDTHAPFLDLLSAEADRRGFGARITTRLADMAEPGIDPGSVDLVWAEGSLYQMGVARGLDLAASLLRPGGYLAFTEAVWRRPDPPAHLRDSFEYPDMGTAQDVDRWIAASPLELVAHFTLPDEAWWEAYLKPLATAVRLVRPRYAADASAQAELDLIQAEIDQHEEFGGFYAYEFFVVRRPG